MVYAGAKSGAFMRMSTPIVLVATALLLVASACKRNQPSEPPTSTEEADTEASPDDDARIIQAMPVPEDGVSVSGTTPKGVTVSLGVPGDWLEAKPPNESTLAVRVAPSGPTAGIKATIVSTDFDGGRTALANYTRTRLESFAAIKSEGATRVGAINGYEFAASWSTAVGNRATVQLLIATGEEAIGISCEMAPDQLDNFSGLCDEIFATLSIEGAKSLK